MVAERADHAGISSEEWLLSTGWVTFLKRFSIARCCVALLFHKPWWWKVFRLNFVLHLRSISVLAIVIDGADSGVIRSLRL